MLLSETQHRRYFTVMVSFRARIRVRNAVLAHFWLLRREAPLMFCMQICQMSRHEMCNEMCNEIQNATIHAPNALFEKKHQKRVKIRNNATMHARN